MPVIDPPSQPSPGKSDGNNTRIVIAVVVPIVVCLILAVSAVIFLRKKKKQIPMEDPEIEAVDEIGAPESVQYSFTAIKAATNNFSDDNKLGQGGFGTVYKVCLWSIYVRTDFGMARLFGQDETQGNTSRIVGTYGYMSPEYLMHGQFSIKSDVFSFGVLILEIISGRRNNSFRNGENSDDLLSYAWKNWRDGTVGNVVDPLLRSSSGSISEMVRCVHMGLLCVQENAGDRPTMASVVLMLSSSSMTLVVPSEPAFYFSSGYGSHDSRLQEYNSTTAEHIHSSKQADKSDHSSQNEASISDLYPR